MTINLPNGPAPLPMLNFAQPAAILPIDSKTKRPRCFSGVYGASTNPKTIRRLFAAAPGSIIAVATGTISGIDVLDIDPRNGGDNWLINNAWLLPQTLVHRTPRGGWHIILRHANGIGCPQTLSKLGVDIKGDGGYVAWPPSTGYSITRATSIKEWPQELLDLVEQYPKPPPSHDFSIATLKETLIDWPQTVPNKCPENRYAQAALQNAWAELIRMGPDSGRGSALHRRAFILGGMICKGWISAMEVAEQLYNASLINGLVDKDKHYHVLRELFRGMNAGLNKPYNSITIEHPETDTVERGGFGHGSALLDDS